MSVVVAGTFRVPTEQVAAVRPHMEAMTRATRAEDGCFAYAYAEDFMEPGLFRVFELWRDQAALDAHIATEHMATWREARAGFGFYDRDIKAYEVTAERQL